MPLTVVVPDVTSYNFEDYIYIRGDENTDGSIRFIADSKSKLVAEKRINEIWKKTSIKTGGNSVYIGDDVKLSAFGCHLINNAASCNYKQVFAHSDFDDTGTINIVVDKIEAKQIRVVSQSDESGEFIGKTFGYIVTSTSDLVLSKVYLKTGTVAATENINIEVYKGTDDTGILFYEDTLNSTEFPANTEIEINVDDLLGYEEGQPVYAVFSSDADFSLKTNSSIDSPWRAADFQQHEDANLVYHSPWEEATYAKGDLTVDDGNIYICNTSGSQTGTFDDNINLWDTLGEAIEDSDSQDNFSYNNIVDDNEVEVPINQQMAVHGTLYIENTLILNGDLAIRD